MIGHTQPRRIAARSVAERIAEELGTELGDLVGYQVRFTDRTSQAQPGQADDRRHPARRAAARPAAASATTRSSSTRRTSASLNIDFLLGYLKRLLPRRPDLKLIITSATIDVERFAAHFDAPGGRGVRPHLPGRGPLPAAGRSCPRTTTRASRSSATRPRRSSTRPRAVRRGAGRRPGLPARRAGDPGHRRRARRGWPTRPDRGRAALLAALGRRAAPGLRAAHRPPRRARDQRRRDVADRAGHPVRRRHRRRADLAATRCAPRCSGCRSRRSARPRPTSAPGAAAGSGRASRSGSTPRRTSRAGRSSPTPRSCGPTWPASSCR